MIMLGIADGEGMLCFTGTTSSAFSKRQVTSENYYFNNLSLLGLSHVNLGLHDQTIQILAHGNLHLIGKCNNIYLLFFLLHFFYRKEILPLFIL